MCCYNKCAGVAKFPRLIKKGGKHMQEFLNSKAAVTLVKVLPVAVLFGILAMRISLADAREVLDELIGTAKKDLVISE